MVTKLRSQRSRKFLNQSNNSQQLKKFHEELLFVINHAFQSLSRKILCARTLKRDGEENRSEEKRKTRTAKKRRRKKEKRKVRRCKMRKRGLWRN
jgi:hypothetical protein